MPNLVVAYHTVTGTTGELAHSIAAGISESGLAEPVLLEILGNDIVEGRYINQEALDIISNADGVVFGSPTFMGSVSAQFKAFADASSELWSESRWVGKVAAGVTTGSSYSGDQLHTIQYLHILACQHGMLWVGVDILGSYDELQRNRLGAHSGLIAQTDGTEVHPKDRETAVHFGARIARFTSVVASSGVKI